MEVGTAVQWECVTCLACMPFDFLSDDSETRVDLNPKGVFISSSSSCAPSALGLYPSGLLKRRLE